MASDTGGALPAQMPPSSGRSGSDMKIARTTAGKLLAAAKATRDPELKSAFTQSLSQLHSYLAQDSAADKRGQAPKVKPAVREAKPVKRK